MFLAMATVVLASNLVAAAPGELPRFNLDLSCRGVEVPGLERGRTAEVCKRSEQNARDQLTKQWAQFPTADKNRCVQLATMGGVESYVELITCLEMAREVRILRNKNNETTGTAGFGSNPASGKGQKLPE